MDNPELEKRLADLSGRCGKKAVVTHSGFLTPAEKALAQGRTGRLENCSAVFSGGRDFCERTAVFFVPDYLEEYFTPDEYISAVKIRAYFGEPDHRSYLGAILALGIERNRIGDIVIKGDTAWVFCMNTVTEAVKGIEKVGRCGVKAEEVPLNEVPEPVIQTKRVTFTVMSLRLDAIVAGMFNLSRTEAADRIRQGLVSHNYVVEDRVDVQMKADDIISLKGSGKGRLAEIGGTTRKGRTYVSTDIYV